MEEPSIEPDALAALIARAHAEAPSIALEPLSCGAWPWTGESVPGRVYCDSERHYHGTGKRAPAAGRRCPLVIASEVRARVAGERERLKGTLDRIGREGGCGWEGYETADTTARTAYEAARRFAAGRPPERGLYLRGGTGRGKTRLLLAAYFELLEAGVDARFVTPAKLREVFAALRSDDDGDRVAAQAMRTNLKRAAVVILDDIGLAGDERFAGDFREKLKDLLDESRAVWAVATNFATDELSKSPDVGAQNLSRLVDRAEVVLMGGTDYRQRRAKVQR